MTQQRDIKINIFETTECAREFPAGDLHDVSCNLCGSDDARTLFSEGAFDIKICASCSLMYVSPQPTTEALADYYAAFYTETSDVVVDSWSHTVSFRQMRKLIEMYGPDKGKLVDIGCGLGLFLQTLDEKWQRTGIEPSADACERGRRAIPQAEFLNGSVLSVPVPEETIDVATSMASLEHMADPSAVVRRMAKMLKPGGLALVRVPYLGGFLRLKPYMPWMPIEFGAPRHLYDFSPRTFRKLFEQNGFLVARMYVASREKTTRPLVAAALLAAKAIAKAIYYATAGTYIWPFSGSILIVAYRSTKPLPE